MTRGCEEGVRRFTKAEEGEMGYTHRSVVALVLLAVGARSASAQSPSVAVSDLRPNERLYLSSPALGSERSEKVKVVRAGSDTLWVARRSNDTSIPLLVRELRSATVARGTRTSWARAVFGGVGGAVAGFAAGWLSCFAITCDGGMDGDDSWFRLLLGFGAGAVGGAKLGYGPHDVWVPVALPARDR